MSWILKHVEGYFIQWVILQFWILKWRNALRSENSRGGSSRWGAAGALSQDGTRARERELHVVALRPSSVWPLAAPQQNNHHQRHLKHIYLHKKIWHVPMNNNDNFRSTIISLIIISIFFQQKDIYLLTHCKNTWTNKGLWGWCGVYHGRNALPQHPYHSIIYYSDPC